MRKTATVLLVASLIAMVFSGFQPSSAENPGEIIGEYHQLGSTDDLTTSHTSWADDVLEVEGPPLTDKLKVETEFLKEELGAWSSDREFTVGDEVVEFDAQDASIVNLSLGPEPVFTMGASDQIEFLERPMWIGVEQADYGDPITLDLEDGDSSGQQIYIAKDWLWERGIHKPNVTHEDGTVLPVNQTEDGKGFVIEVPHFSEIVVEPADLDIKGRQGGVLFPHTTEVRWYEDEKRLEIDVSQQVDNYDVLVEMDWVTVNVGAPWVWANDYEWGAERVKEKAYHVASLSPDETPTTLVMMDAPWEQVDLEFNFTDFENRIEASEPVTIPSGWNSSLEISLVFDSEPWNLTVLDEDGQLKQVLARNLTTEPSNSDVRVNLVQWGGGFTGGRCLPDEGQSYGQQGYYNTLKAGELSMLSTIKTSDDNVHLLPRVSLMDCNNIGGAVPWVFADAEADAERADPRDCEGDPHDDQVCFEMSERSEGWGATGQWGEVQEQTGHFGRTCTWQPPEGGCENPWKSTTHWDTPQDPTNPTHNPCVNMFVVATAGIQLPGGFYPLSTHSDVAEAWCE